METGDDFLAKALFEDVLTRAIADVRERKTPVYTFAFYHDHESSAVSVCVDTKENSRRVVSKINTFNMEYFKKAVTAGDLKTAIRWKANTGRSLALGDFAENNLARTSHRNEVTPGKDFYLDMVRALITHQREIAALAPNPDELLFCCSSADDEVGFLWSLDTDTSN
jgi:WD40 repeat protein